MGYGVYKVNKFNDIHTCNATYWAGSLLNLACHLTGLGYPIAEKPTCQEQGIKYSQDKVWWLY